MQSFNLGNPLPRQKKKKKKKKKENVHPYDLKIAVE